MTIAQHATNILDAWKLQDYSGLGAALDSASVSRTSQKAAGIESERGEVLESIVDHLRQLANREVIPAPAGRNGALSLLAHLSLDLGGKTLEEKNSKSATNLPK
ncbi:MAG TPA: hypothetical protein VKX25_02465 [Bryobacteraceae bacterium]|nr:hypothetical protein [Bryobacteraceae bacterium]